MRANTPRRNKLRRTPAFLLCVLSLACAAVASGDQPAPGLKTRADAAEGKDRISYSLDYAHHELENANSLYESGDVEKAEASVAEVVTYAHRAAETAIAINKHLKQTEIDLRKLQHRMHDIGATLAVEDRPVMDKGEQQVEQMRSELLTKMFGPKAEPKDKSQ